MPKQSGPALWVGNLPHGICIVDLKEYFSQGVSDQIESVFLISRSHCAFINYKTEAACSAAQKKFHDSRFQGCRLVCRLRRPAGSRENSGDVPDIAAEKSEGNDAKAAVAGSSSAIPFSNERVPNRYFIVKSMTVEDLESSRESCIWATQTHNEVNLNRAYEVRSSPRIHFPPLIYWQKLTLNDSDPRPRIMCTLSFPQTSPGSTMDMPGWCRQFRRMKSWPWKCLDGPIRSPRRRKSPT